ncbi:septation ring formation regulator EzrA [Alkalihalobacillus sp. AL-G]|uniref:septation ring formation regulator EzrA n=1 Tax=Alkalihalobacillus sp. AL-G TaxID=2926399 RepID=UPI00272977E7|nr:septation ring formation regulator EzrA [Alkalihalobacillus sp. AL-G]WLD92386.1 septation ring formation regulator EzrA [Alkalihalobacillus sp. AL-G]
MIYILVALVVVLSVFIGFGTYSRKKVYDQIDHLESQKINIMNRPLSEEIAKVKALEMIGETEKKFESWRSDWDEIVAVELPDLEENLFDAEEAADKYRFKKARGILSETRRQIFNIEEMIDEISGEIDELVKSEELNRKEIAEMTELHKGLRKHLITHYRALGPLAEKFEARLEEISTDFSKYGEETENGNHIGARTYIVQLDEKLRDLKYKLEVVPDLLYQFQTEIPAMIKELKEGLAEMNEQGYRVDQLGIEKELEVVHYAYDLIKEKVNAVEVQAAKEEMSQLNKKLEELYDMLESEVLAKQFVLSEGVEVKKNVEKLGNEIQDMKEETNVVRLSYQIEQENIDLQERLENSFEKIEKRASTCFHSIEEEDQSFTSIKEVFDTVTKQLEELREMTEIYKEKLQNLRKDELDAVDKIQEFRKKLIDANKEVHRNNLPGLPETYYDALQDAEYKLQVVSSKLSDKPLQMADVLNQLIEAEEAVDEVYSKTNHLIDRAIWAERLIQYGNRYRSKYITVAVKLSEAEQAFRTYEYEIALEHAAEALDSVEPGILKEFEESFQSKETV